MFHSQKTLHVDTEAILWNLYEMEIMLQTKTKGMKDVSVFCATVHDNAFKKTLNIYLSDAKMQNAEGCQNDNPVFPVKTSSK